MYQVGYGPSFGLSAFTGSTGLRGGPLHWSATRARGRDVEVVEVVETKHQNPLVNIPKTMENHHF